MHYHPESNTYVKDGEAFTLNGTQYPWNWDRASLGFVEVTTIGTREDDRYYWVSEEVKDGVRTITNTPKDPEQIKAMESAKKLAEIDSLEKSQMLPRVTREFMLAAFEAQASVAGVDPLTNFAYSKVKDLDTKINDLRATL
jgi:hypothetical protein